MNSPHPKAIGRHLIADLGNIDTRHLQDAEGTMNALRQALTEVGFSIVGETCHRFSGGGEGFTGVFLLAESHASIHTYPEHEWLAFDLFSCGDGDPDEVLRRFIAAIGASTVRKETFERRLH